MEIQRSEWLFSIVVVDFERIISLQSNVSMDGDYAEQTKSISAGHWLSSRSSGRNIETNDRHRVKTSLSLLFPRFLWSIWFSCVIRTMCDPQLEFQRINPTTQVALFALCPADCATLVGIHWQIYRGSSESASNNFTDWILFTRSDLQENQLFFGNSACFLVNVLSDRFSLCLSLRGTKTSNFTASHDLFSWNVDVRRWRFEVVYSFSSGINSSSSLNFEINSSPSNGSCSITPVNGSTTTLFNVSCPNWSDQDEIKDYSLLSLFVTDQITFSSSLSPSRFSRTFATNVDRLLLGIDLRSLSSRWSRWEFVASVVDCHSRSTGLCHWMDESFFDRCSSGSPSVRWSGQDFQWRIDIESIDSIVEDRKRESSRTSDQFSCRTNQSTERGQSRKSPCRFSFTFTCSSSSSASSLQAEFLNQRFPFQD